MVVGWLCMVCGYMGMGWVCVGCGLSMGCGWMCWGWGMWVLMDVMGWMWVRVCCRVYGVGMGIWYGMLGYYFMGILDFMIS